jgi:sporulation protein YlmC with PRC-barrel domain
MTTMKNHPEDVVKSDEVIGVAVKNSAKEDVGKIEEIVLDKVSGQTRYVVLSFGGLLGMGDKYFALPWKSISYSPEDAAFILSVSKERLEKAPGFDKNNWPNFADQTWARSIETYYV